MQAPEKEIRKILKYKNSAYSLTKENPFSGSLFYKYNYTNTRIESRMSTVGKVILQNYKESRPGVGKRLRL